MGFEFIIIIITVIIVIFRYIAKVEINKLTIKAAGRSQGSLFL